MNKKDLSIILLIILVGVLGYMVLTKKPVSIEPLTNNSQNNIDYQPVFENTQQNTLTIPINEYVYKTYDSAKQATFVFVVPIMKQDITSKNIKYCVLSGSAGTARDSECKETTSANGFSVTYNEDNRAIGIYSPNEWGSDTGIFRIGCASCVSAVEFSGIHTSDGRLLPTIMVRVY